MIVYGCYLFLPLSWDLIIALCEYTYLLQSLALIITSLCTMISTPSHQFPSDSAFEHFIVKISYSIQQIDCFNSCITIVVSNVVKLCVVVASSIEARHK